MGFEDLRVSMVTLNKLTILDILKVMIWWLQTLAMGLIMV